MLVDSHCHLDFPDYADQVDQVVARATDAGVGVCLSIGTELKRFPGVKAVAEKFPNVWCSVGVHPHESEKELLDDEAALIREDALDIDGSARLSVGRKRHARLKAR